MIRNKWMKRVLGIVGAVAMAAVTAFSVPSYKIEVNAATPTIALEYCQLIDQKTIRYKADLNVAPPSDDGMLYLFELKTYQYEIPAESLPVASTPITTDVTLKFELGSTSAMGRLYSKYALATRQGGKLVMLGNPQYISNPEMLAKKTVRKDRDRKTTQDQWCTNVSLTGTGVGSVPVSHVQHTMQVLVKEGTVVTHPSVSDGTKDAHTWEHSFYMMNAANDAGIQGLVADLTNYAANSGAQDFIIGNEVNQRKWNYMAWTDWDSFVREYMQVFRVCYTAIKSQNAAANVYLSIDQCWDRNRPTSHAEYYSYIDAKDFLIKFNSMINAGGNINWNVACHPYTVPLTYSKFWDLSGCDVETPAYCRSQVADGHMMTFQNISLLTDLLSTTDFQDQSGHVRDIIINEIGIDATHGEDNQIAALCAAFKAFERHPQITQFIYLNNLGDGVDSRLSERGWEVFNALGTPAEDQYMDWAKKHIGITEWSEVLK